MRTRLRSPVSHWPTLAPTASPARLTGPIVTCFTSRDLTRSIRSSPRAAQSAVRVRAARPRSGRIAAPRPARRAGRNTRPSRRTRPTAARSNQIQRFTNWLLTRFRPGRGSQDGSSLRGLPGIRSPFEPCKVGFEDSTAQLAIRTVPFARCIGGPRDSIHPARARLNSRPTATPGRPASPAGRGSAA